MNKNNESLVGTISTSDQMVDDVDIEINSNDQYTTYREDLNIENIFDSEDEAMDSEENDDW